MHKVLFLCGREPDSDHVRKATVRLNPELFQVKEQAWDPEGWELQENETAVILLSLPPGPKGMDLVSRVLRRLPDIPMVVVTGSRNSCFPLMRLGVQDCLLRERFGVQELERVLLLSMERMRYQAEQKKSFSSISLQQQRLQALGQMASGMVHDIRNTLSPLVGYTEMLLASGEFQGRKTKTYLENMIHAAGDMEKIINRIRGFYKVSDDEHKMPVYINTILEQVIGLILPHMRKIQNSRDITFSLRKELDPANPRMLAVEQEIRQALVNVVLNALDAMPRGGRLFLATQATERWTTVTLRDSGKGMTAPVLEQCQDPFFTTKGDQGTGLGLAVVQDIMDRHKGTVEILSRPGQGTTIRLCFPREGVERSLASGVGPKMTPLPFSSPRCTHAGTTGQRVCSCRPFGKLSHPGE